MGVEGSRGGEQGRRKTLRGAKEEEGDVGDGKERVWALWSVGGCD